MNFIDDFLGIFNFFPKIFGGLFLLSTKSNGKYSKWNLVIFSIKRKDKGGKYTKTSIINHLEKYGVKVVWWNYNSTDYFFAVKKNQEVWARKLLGNAIDNGALWYPKKGWK